MDMSHARTTPALMPAHGRGGALARTLLIGLIAFLTVIDLFGTQAILPALTRAYGVTPAAMGLAVNASTFGMAVAGLGVAYFSRRIDRRRGILASLALLAVPTALLASAPDLATFALLRVAQGLCMASAFTLTLAYLGEHCDAMRRGRRLRGLHRRQRREQSLRPALRRRSRRPSRARADLLWARRAQPCRRRSGPSRADPRDGAAANEAGASRSPFATWTRHLADPRLRASFAIGFCILFAFIGTFTYVNFVLVRPPIGLDQMALGFVYFVFLPSIATTLAAGRAVERLGTRPALWAGLGTAAAGLPLLVLPSLPAVLAGLALVGIGTFFAQATATGFVSRTAAADRASASGLYLASYFLGGLVGSAVLGQIFDRFGWAACVAGIGAALAARGALRPAPR